MKTLDGGIHVFTQRPDLAVKAFYREAENLRKMDEIYQRTAPQPRTPPHQIVIQYQNAVSSIRKQFFYTCDYMAIDYSSRRKSPVLISIAGSILCSSGEESQIFQSYWGKEKTCIAKVELKSAGSNVVASGQEINRLKESFGHLLPEDSVLFQPLENITPLHFADLLGTELGILLNTTKINQFLKNRCTVFKEHPYATFFKAQ